LPEPNRAVHARAVPSDDDLALADDVSGQLIRLVRLVDRRHAQYQAEHPDAVERATYFLLVHLVKGGPQRAGALAEAVHSDPSTISRQVAHLVRLGLVERMADPEDGRATLLTATDEGRRVFEENRRMRIERFAGLLSDWPVEDRRKFAELLDRFATAFEGTHQSQ
jgi:DNA-binding MarR family transcriptional regulator